MYSLQIPSTTSSIAVEPPLINIDIPYSVSNTPQTPEIINTLMAIAHPLDNVVPSKKEEGNNIPKTPEIINTLMAISNPLEKYVTNSTDKMNSPTSDTATNSEINIVELKSDDKSKLAVSATVGGTPQTSTPIQNICSQLIKEELKVTLRKRREHQLSSSSSCSLDCPELLPLSDCSLSNKTSSKIDSDFVIDTEEEDPEDRHASSGNDLTEEDEEKRRKRRERNKIAATKCRLKKKVKTVSLEQESELLENQNCNLKNQIQELETQRTRLMDMLQSHKRTCIKGFKN